MKKILMESIMAEAGSEDRVFYAALMKSPDFLKKFDKLVHAKMDIGLLQNSHIMNKSDKNHHETMYVSQTRKVAELHKEIVAIAKAVLVNVELRQFELASTEHLSKLSVKDVMAKLENGEITSIAV